MAGPRDDGTFAEDTAHHPNRRVSRKIMSGRMGGHPDVKFGYQAYPEGYAPSIVNPTTGLDAETEDRMRSKRGARRIATKMYKKWELE